MISDYSLPQLNAAAALETVREADPDVPFIIVSGTIGEERAVAAMRAGAQDYILKGEGLDRLAPAVEREIREAANRRVRREEEVARRKAEQEVRKLAAIVESSADTMISLALDGTILSWNAGAEGSFGYGAEEMVGVSVMQVVPSDREEAMAETLARIAEGRSMRDVETVGSRSDGTSVDISLTISPIYDDEGSVVAASTVARDITDRKRAESRLAFLSDHDLLTGLFNRRRFDQELAREIVLAQRYESSGAVLVLGLDNFKLVNDTLGHQAGDELIRRVAELLSKKGDVDTIARIGGDEFAVILRNGDAEGVARELLEIVKEQPLVGGPVPTRITASIGIAPLTGEGVTSEELIAQADLAMYEAKDAGRDSFTLFEPAHGREQQMGERLPMAERIRKALEEDSFLLHCQPILEISSGRISQYELLLRMLDADGEVISPGAFLSTADRFGLIEAIDCWVVTQAIELIAEHQAAGRDTGSRSTSRASMGDESLLRPHRGRSARPTSTHAARLRADRDERDRQHRRGPQLSQRLIAARLPVRARRLRRRVRLLLLPQVPSLRLPQDRRRLHPRPPHQPHRPVVVEATVRSPTGSARGRSPSSSRTRRRSSCCAATASTTRRATTWAARSRSRTSTGTRAPAAGDSDQQRAVDQVRQAAVHGLPLLPHADLLGDPSRRVVVGRDQRHRLLQRELPRPTHRRLRRLGREAPVPVLGGDRPGQLDHIPVFEPGPLQPPAPDHQAALLLDQGPGPEPVFIPMLFVGGQALGDAPLVHRRRVRGPQPDLDVGVEQDGRVAVQVRRLRLAGEQPFADLLRGLHDETVSRWAVLGSNQ